MTHWIEHREDGYILHYAMCPVAPPAQSGGVVSETFGPVRPGCALRIEHDDGHDILDVGAPPSVFHVFDVAAGVWAVPGKTDLEVAQDAKWGEIRRERDRCEQAGFPYMGGWLESDPISVHRMTVTSKAAEYALAHDVAFNETWTAADNSRIPMTAEDVIGMIPAFAVWGSHLHAIARTLRDAIYAEDATLASVAAIAWPET